MRGLRGIAANETRADFLAALPVSSQEVGSSFEEIHVNRCERLTMSFWQTGSGRRCACIFRVSGQRSISISLDIVRFRLNCPQL